MEYQTVMHRMDGPNEEVFWFLPTAYSQVVLSERNDIVEVVDLQCWKQSRMRDFSRCIHINIPINDSDTHWYLLVVLVDEQVAEVWDSKPHYSVFTRRLKQVRRLLRSLDAVLVEEKCKRFSPKSWNFIDFKIEFRDDIAHQVGDFDCGLFVMKYLISPLHMQEPSYKYNSDSERASLSVTLLSSMWNGIRTTLFDLAEGLYKDVASGTVAVVNQEPGQRHNDNGPPKKNTHERSLQGGPLHNIATDREIDEVVEENSHLNKRKRYTKSLKELLEGGPKLYVKDGVDSIDQSTNV